MNLHETNSYRIANEDGEGVLSYLELLDSPIIESIRDANDQGSHVALYLGRTVFVYPKTYLLQSKIVAETFREMEMAWIRNPLQFFAPSGPGATEFVNDLSSKICFITAGNRSGKTATAIIKMILGSIDTNPNWPIFTEHGVNWRQGRVHNIGIGSYEWGNHKKTLGPELLKWLPHEVCPDYIPKKRGCMGKRISWKDNPVVAMSNSSEFHFYAYNQDQAPFESEALQGWLWDEQPTEEKWVGANERIRSSRYAQHNHVLTPHRLPDNPNTGAGTFLHRLYRGQDLKGYQPSHVSRHTINLVHLDYTGEGHAAGDVPEWVYPEASKEETYQQHIAIPSSIGNMKALRSGRARLYGEFEESEGLVYDDWYRPIHWIEPFPIPKNASLYRTYDHGRRNPGAGLWGAIPKPGSTYTWETPTGEKTVKYPENEVVLILYREYYQRDTLISAHCQNIIELSGNDRIARGETRVGSATYQVFQEHPTSERYIAALDDPRSHNRPDDELPYTLGDIYGLNGLAFTPSTVMRVRERIDVVREWMKPDYNRKHVFTGEPGFVKLMVFNNLQFFTEEMEGYRNKAQASRRGVSESNLAEEPQSKNDHLMDCLSWLCCYGPYYVEVRQSSFRTFGLDNEFGSGINQEGRRNVDPITKY